ncbi:hypothetical protein AB0C70_42195 [Streptomyces sp. NPDC048564]|uniref:hypothetical protein n=1 Tax=Streptomyces sp. NPDC048564 TaxID=3155760 RepID=UPI00341AC1D5
MVPHTLDPFVRTRPVEFAERWFGDAGGAEEYVRQVDLAGLGPLVRVPLLARPSSVRRVMPTTPAA